MSHESTAPSWTLQEWKSLCEHPSPFVRLWVAKAARKHTDRDSLNGLLRTLLEDERALVRYHAERDLLDESFADLAEWYLQIALRSTSRWGQVRSALESLAAIGDGDRLLTWLEETYAKLCKAGPERESILQHVFTLSGYLALMPLSRAEPVAERLLGILRELNREQGELLGEPSEEGVTYALAGLLLSHPRPREVLDFQDQLDCPLDLPEAISEIIGDRDWVNRLYGNGHDADDADDTYGFDIWGDGDDDEDDAGTGGGGGGGGGGGTLGSEYLVSGLSPQTIEVTQGETITVSATVESDGIFQETKDVELRVDGETLSTQEVSLAGGDTLTVEFTDVGLGDIDAGEYEFGIYTPDSDVTGTITITAPDGADGDDGDADGADGDDGDTDGTDGDDATTDGDDGGEGTDDSTPGFGVLATLVAVLVSLGYLTRRT